VAAAVMLTDAPWAIALGRERGHRRYYLGAAVTLFVVWPLLVSAGVPLGSRIGAVPVASLLLPLTLGAVVVPQLRQRPAATAIVAASACAVLTVQLPAGLALALAGLIGGIAGVVTERLS
jgi:predicted branched-subunit amino acid permease